MARPHRLAPALAAWIGAAGCITPSVLDESKRAVDVPLASLVWTAARAEDLRGLFESVAIEGDAAAGMAKVLYHFDTSGSYTGAALLIGGETPQFQTLSGRWTLAESGLDLGDGTIVRAQIAGDYLRLSSEGGVATLRRAAIE